MFPLPGVFVTILTVGFAWLAFAGILLLVAQKWPHNPFSDALNSVYGSGTAA